MMNKTIILIDFLNCMSCVQLFLINMGRDVQSIRYAQATKNGLFFSKVLSKVFSIDFQEINYSQSDSEVNRENFYLSLQKTVRDFLERYYSKKYPSNDSRRYREFLKEQSIFLVYRPIELCLLAKKDDENKYLILFARSRISREIEKEFRELEICNYYKLLNLRTKHTQRNHFFYDDLVSNAQVSTSYLFFRNLLKQVLIFLLQKFVPQRNGKGPKILAEMWQSNYRKKEINDLYWLSGLEERGREVVFLTPKIPDSESVEELRKMEVEINLIPTPRNIISFLKKTDERITFLKLPIKLLNVVKLFFSGVKNLLILDNEENYLSSLFNYESDLWLEIYQKNKIQIVWSMVDVDNQRHQKALALEKLNKKYAGAHWSYVPMVSSTINKCYHMFFVWGEHFQNEIFKFFRSEEVFITGYPLDYYFSEQKNRLSEKKEEGQFYLGFMDNLASNDVAFSVEKQNKLYHLFELLLEEVSDLKLVLKPKRKHFLNKVWKGHPNLKKYFENDRIVVLASDDPRRKYVPVTLAGLCDVVIGQSSNTAAMECLLAGTPTLFFDPTYNLENEFNKINQEKIVYKEIDQLKKRVLELKQDASIYPFDGISLNSIDPYRDGLAAKRTGEILFKYFDQLRENLSE